jgi:hypothetical protein
MKKILNAEILSDAKESSFVRPNRVLANAITTRLDSSELSHYSEGSLGEERSGSAEEMMADVTTDCQTDTPVADGQCASCGSCGSCGVGGDDFYGS